MSDIVTFLRARLDEDEVIWSRAADLAPDVPVVISVADRPGVVVPRSVTGAVSPRRMLREVEAKRRIMDLAWGMEEAKRQVLVLMASVYADHPDYDPEWENE